MSAAGLTRAEGWGAIAPRPRSARATVTADDHCRKLLRVDRESQATTACGRSFTNTAGVSPVTGSIEQRLGKAISARLADNESTARDVP